MSEAKKVYEKAYANLGGVGMSCFLTSREQDEAFNKAFKGVAIASRNYILELESSPSSPVGEEMWNAAIEEAAKSVARWLDTSTLKIRAVRAGGVPPAEVRTVLDVVDLIHNEIRALKRSGE